MKYIVIFKAIQLFANWPQDNREYRIFDTKKEVNEFIAIDNALKLSQPKIEILGVYEAKEIPLIKKIRKETHVTEVVESVRIEE